MKFKKIPIEKANKSILAHSINLDVKRLSKGKVLNNNDITLLKKNKISHITCATLNSKDIHEDKVANILAKNFQNKFLATEKAFTGRANILASKSGLLVIDERKINKFNNISEDITIATLNNYIKVNKGDMVATIKIISFSIHTNKLKFVKSINLKSAIIINTLKKKKCGLILTQGLKENPKLNELSEKRVRERLDQNNYDLEITIKCSHDKDAISEKIKFLKKKNCDLILILGVSAIVDIRDEIPTAIKISGGKIIRFGMPVDPGNLLLVAKNKIPIIGLPGCARSPTLNGFDWILERTAAEISINSNDISKMGVGGLLKTNKRPKIFRAIKSNYKICTIILAAGKSKRMLEKNKLLLKLKKHSMIEQVSLCVSKSKSYENIIVLGHQHDIVENHLKKYNFKVVVNEKYMNGISSSIISGISALPEDCDAVIIMLGDMPNISPKLLNNMIDSFNPRLNRNIVIPSFESKLGNPVLLSRFFFPDILNIKGDIGAKNIIKRNMNSVYKLSQTTNASLLDIDTKKQLKSYLKS